MLIETLLSGLKKVRETNATDNGFPSRVPTATRPSGTGNNAAQASASAVFPIGNAGLGQNSLLIVPYGTGADNATMSLRVIGWSEVGFDPATSLWIPVPLLQLDCTLGAAVGVAGKDLVATERFADTIAIGFGNEDVSVDIVSPANDLIGHAMLSLKGFELFEMTFTTGGSATACNALWKMQ